MPTRPIPILHAITGLNTGGAEMMLYKLLSAHDAARFAPVVVSLSGHGTLGPRIEEMGIPVFALGLMQDAHLQQRGELARQVGRASAQLAQIVRQMQPRLVQGWMYHGNLAATAAACMLFGRVPTAWNVRQSLYDITAEKPFTQIAIRANARLSFQPQVIIYNSATGAQHHEHNGFAPSKRRMIPNGFDCERFQPQPGAHAWLCHELGLPPESVLVGLIGRYHDMKDHHNLVQAAGQLAPQMPDVHFVLAGRDVTPNNKVLRQQIAEAQVSSRFHVLGERADIPRLMAGLDVLVSSSWTEGFSNVIGEAMACGAPCVVTDVGESAAIVGEAGLVVPPRDPKGLASALSALIAAGPEYRHMLGQKARRRVLDVYSMPQITRQYDSLYLELVACSRSSQGAN